MTMDSIEQWRPIKKLPGYEVSDLGRIKRLAKKDAFRKWTCKEGRSIPEMLITHSPIAGRYNRIRVHINKKRTVSSRYAAICLCHALMN